MLYFIVCIFGLAAALMPIAVHKLERGLFPWSLVCAMIFAAGAIGMFLFLQRKRLELVLLSLLAVMLGTSLVASIAVFPYLDGYKSPRPIGEFVRSHLAADSRVYVFKSTMADFNFYARREKLPVVNSADDVKKLTLSGQEVYLIVNDKDLKQFKFDSMFNAVTEQQIGEKKWYLLRFS